MILVDANLLIYAFDSRSPHHSKALFWLDDALQNRARVGLPWPSLLAFLRIVVNPRLFSAPATIAQAWAQIERWLDFPAAWIPQPGEQHSRLLATCLRNISSPNGVPDAHLAALALEHGLILCTADSGFARFRELRFQNPLL